MFDLVRVIFNFIKTKGILIFCLLIPFLIYFDVIFLPYTISFNEVSIKGGSFFGNLLSVSDPAAGSYQDHPWLFKIGHSLRQGFIPLVNFENGLGAPLLESIQSGIFYPLNILLILLNLSSSQFFDLFSVFHVFILLTNSFLLFKLFVRWEAALILATAFALSPLTFTQVNMVHYRAFVWTPLMVWAAVKIARQQHSTSTVLITVISVICSITAGNPQESFFGFLVTFALFMSEFLIRQNFYPKQFFILFLSFFSGVLISLPAILPYLLSKSMGLLNSVEDPGRSMSFIRPQWLFSWIVPYINGAYPNPYRTPFTHDEISTFAIHPLLSFLLVASLFLLFIDKRIYLRDKLFFITVFLLGMIGVISITEDNLLQPIVKYIPFVNTVRLTKYTNYIYLIFAISASLGVSWLCESNYKTRNRTITYSTIAFTLLVLLLILLQVKDTSFLFNFEHFPQLLLIWLGSIIPVVTCIYIFQRNQNWFNWKLLLGSLLIAALAMKPYGFQKALEKYRSFPIQSIDFARERLLSNADIPNSNLLRSYGRIEVFDPILNKSFSNFFNKHFQALNQAFWLQIPKDTVISTAQMELLRLMGVTAIYGYEVEDPQSVHARDGSFMKVRDPLPPIFLLSTIEPIQNACSAENYSAALKLLRDSLIAQPLSSELQHKNGLKFELDKSGTGTLVALQAFSPAWKFNGESASQFCGVFTAWTGDFEAGKHYEIKYIPPGLRISYIFVILGLLILLATAKLASVKPREI